MSTTDPLDLDAIEERLDAATPGPWESDGNYSRAEVAQSAGWQTIVGTEEVGHGHLRENVLVLEGADSQFIAHARTDVPALVARVRELTPRVLEGDWETVRDALDALPEGAQIRWQEGYPLHSFVGMKTTSVFGDTRWSSVGSDGSFDHLSSTGIAHNDSPIEVLA